MVARITNEISIGQGHPLTVIAGPCVVENEQITLETATRLKEITTKLNLPFIFKSSYKKANRTSFASFSTIGVEKALAILHKIKISLNVPILTDVHEVNEVKLVAEVSDIIQIPAFLCRQTDLIVAAAHSGRAVNIKKGQFMAPEDMDAAAKKVLDSGNPNVLLTERGTTFGYHNLVVDMRGLVIMSDLGYPVVFDATHSTQLPAGAGSISGGQPKYALPLAKAAIATGACQALFVETHPNPAQALSDPQTQQPLAKMESFLQQVKMVYEAVHR